MGKASRIAIAALLLGACLAAQGLEPERIVTDHGVVSVRNPAVRIELPPRMRHIGADRWTLYDVADCEIHVFVDADNQRRVRSFYWIQFEGFLPAKPELRYDYSSDRSIDISGMPFHARARFGTTSEVPKSGSDLERVQRLIARGGFTLPPDMANVRLVHLLDETRRKELMIIYSEDLAPTGLTTADLLPGGAGADRWPAIEAQLLRDVARDLRLTQAAKNG